MPGNGFQPIEPGDGPEQYRHGQDVEGGCGNCVEIGSIYATFEPVPQ